jgi:hypothetical protein
MNCPPGEHPMSWGRHGSICAPDVPGAGLPWDMVTSVSAIIVLVFFTCVIGLLIWMTIQDNAKGRK